MSGACDGVFDRYPQRPLIPDLPTLGIRKVDEMGSWLVPPIIIPVLIVIMVVVYGFFPLYS